MSTIKIRTQTTERVTEVRLLITHPMENGRNRDAVTAELIPAHYIEQLVLKVNNRLVINTRMTGSLSKNPFLTFRLRDLSAGDVLTVEWRDNLQESDLAEYKVE